MDHLQPITLADLCPGDLCYFARPSLIQSLSELIGDPYRGIGVVSRTGGRMSVVYVGRAGFVTAELAAISSRFDAIAIGRRPDCGCIDDVMVAVDQLSVEANHYPLSSLVGAWVLSAARTPHRSSWSGLARRAAGPPLGLLVRGYDLRLRPGHRFICSTFVAAAYDRACPLHRLTVALSGPKGAAVWAEAISSTDRRLARYMLTPSDLWRATPVDRRAALTGITLRGDQP